MGVKARKSQSKEKKHSRGNPEHSEPVEPIAKYVINPLNLHCAVA